MKIDLRDGMHNDVLTRRWMDDRSEKMLFNDLCREMRFNDSGYPIISTIGIWATSQASIVIFVFDVHFCCYNAGRPKTCR